jgi:hypothetical protein
MGGSGRARATMTPCALRLQEALGPHLPASGARSARKGSEVPSRWIRGRARRTVGSDRAIALDGQARAAIGITTYAVLVAGSNAPPKGAHDSMVRVSALTPSFINASVTPAYGMAMGTVAAGALTQGTW